MLIPTYKIICILKKYNIIFQGALHIGAHDCEESRFYSEIGIEPKKIIWIDALQKKVDEARARAICTQLQSQQVGCQLVRR